MPYSNIVLLGGLPTIFPLDFEDSCFFLPLFIEVRGRGQPVEKVVVGPVGSPKHPRTQAKTLQNRGFKPLNRGQKRARGSFSTGWAVLGSPYAGSCINLPLVTADSQLSHSRCRITHILLLFRTRYGVAIQCLACPRRLGSNAIIAFRGRNL
jgi:hypothetical protein